MDTLSHAIIGIAVASFSGQQFSINDPIYLASLLGAQAPDFDIITLLRGNFTFLRQHRAFSHSILGLLFWSVLIAIILPAANPSASVYTSFIWALAGAFSHVALDYFNTHGTAIFWPLKKERKSLHLLNVFDPVLLVLLLSLYLLNLSPLHLANTTFITLFGYISVRYYLRSSAKRYILTHFKDHTLISLIIMPSLKRVFAWDFIINTSEYHYIGQYRIFPKKLDFKINLPKQRKQTALTERAHRTLLGQFFSTFTPFAYYEEECDITRTRINIYDLRYYLNQQFIHRATIIFDKPDNPSEAYLFSEGKTIKIPCYKI